MGWRRFLQFDWTRVSLSGHSHFLGGDYSIRKNKMAGRFSVVSGRSKRRGKCKNLEKIAFRKRQKSYEKN